MFITCRICDAQILCIYCYDQNDSLSDNVNNLLLNGGFENSNCTAYPDANSYICPNSVYYACNIANWSCINGGSETYAAIADTNFTYVAEGNNAVYFGNQMAHACSPIFEDTSCLIPASCTVIGVPVGYPISEALYGGSLGVSLQQIVSGLVPGNTYVLEFWAGGETPNGPNERSGLFAVDVGFGDTLFRDKPTGSTLDIGTRFIIEFNATSSSHTIKFTNWGHITLDCTELVIDDVRLYTLAELSASVPHCVLGIDNTSSSVPSMNIFPNPFSNELNVEREIINELYEIIFYDVTLRRILQQSFTNSISINTEQLAKGVYLYEVRNKNGVIKKSKVVKPACR